jgi:ribosomal protein S18 acetylase RimI-like enzyme
MILVPTGTIRRHRFRRKLNNASGRAQQTRDPLRPRQLVALRRHASHTVKYLAAVANRCYLASMKRRITLTRGTADHYDFALELYISAMRPLTEKLMVWNEEKQRESFASQWKLDEVQIIAVDGKDVGWLQVAELPTEVRLQQFFVAPDRQGEGIGTEVLQRLLTIFRQAGQQVALTVLKNNQARRLYERVGFQWSAKLA